MRLQDLIIGLLLISLVSLFTTQMIGDFRDHYEFNVSDGYEDTYGGLSTISSVTTTTKGLEVGLNESQLNFDESDDNIFDFSTISSVIGATKDSIIFVTGSGGIVRSIQDGLDLPYQIGTIIISIFVIIILSAIAALFLRRSP